MTPEVEEQLEGLLLATGYDDCLLGIAERCGQPNVAAYDAQKIARSLMRQGMSEEEAWEFFYFNISGGYVGELTPVFIHKLCKNQKPQPGPEKKVKTQKAGSMPKAEPATTKRPAATSSRPPLSPRPRKTLDDVSRFAPACRA
jgi:hypothetical protein